MLIHHRKPVEESFILWMNESPESFHALDMKRFYVFVKSVYAYHAKRWKDFSFFRAKIKEKRPTFSEENITRFYDKLCTGLTLLKAPTMPIYDSDDSIARGIMERTVKDGEIVDVHIKN